MRTGFDGDDSRGNETNFVAGVSLRRVLPTATFFQCEDFVATVLEPSTERLQGGEVCVYRAGEDDPVEFAAIVLAKGAAAILTDQLLPCPLPQVIVADVEQAGCELMNELCQRPSEKLMMIGVVGNAGKTTTALMIAGVLRGLGIRTAYESDLGSSDGVVQSVDAMPVARGAALVAKLSDARDASCGAAVIEFSSVVAAAHAGIMFDLVVITGSSTLVAETQNGEAYFGPDTLMIALDHLARDGVVIVPADHPKLVRRVDDAGYKRLTYGLRREADVSAKVFDSQPGEMTLMVSCGDETAAMETKQCGEAMAMNQLAAIAIAMLMETSLVDAIETVSRLPGIPGRMQRFSSFDTAAVVIDAGGDWSRISTTLRTLRQQRCGGKLWCVMTLGDVGPIGGDEGMAICGRQMERYADRVVLTSTDQNKEKFLQSAHCLLDGFRKVTVARLVADQKRAIQWAVQHAAPQDTILILGGVDGETANERRTAIQSLEKIVERCQQDPKLKRYESPATIPMPGVV